MENQLTQSAYFGSGVYTVKAPQFLESVRAVSKEALAVSRPPKKNKIYPSVMTVPYGNDPRIADFAAYVSQTAWNILHAQGYAMEPLVTVLGEMWTQEHLKAGGMEQHVHGQGAQMCAFYFLDCPPDCGRLVVHDPRPGRLATMLPQQDMNTLTDASDAVYFAPEDGLLVFANAWLPHSITRNASDKPFHFTHMNITTMPAVLAGVKPETADVEVV